MISKISLPIFILLALLNLIAGIIPNEDLAFFTKPLLMPSLALWFYFKTKSQPSLFRTLILSALFFSWGGDVLLMFVESKGEHFFLLGLVSFLLAHLFYATAFFKTISWRSGFLQKTKWAVIPFLIFFIGFNYFLISDVPEEMQVPVIIYSSVIVIMALAALNWNTFVNKNTFLFLFLGALTFMFSDMVIALNKFKSPIPYSHLWIMGMYLLGQFWIINGAKEFCISKLPLAQS